MSGPITSSPFPRGRLSKLWEYFVGRLQADLILRSAVDDWYVRTGSIEDEAPTTIKEGKVGLALTTQGGQLQWTDEQRHGGSWTIALDLYLPTTAEVWALDAWEAVYNAMPWPNLPAHYTPMVTEYGCYEIVMAGPSFTREDSTSAVGMKASGQIQLLFNVSSYP